MKAKQFFSAIMLVLLLASSLTGCGGQTKSADAGATDLSVAVMAQYDEPVRDWDPAISYTSDGHVFLNTYETLLRYNNKTDQYDPVLATDYTVSDDALTWTFHLRKGVKFHDGTDFTAAAVKYSIDRTKNMGQGAYHLWNALKEIKIVDDYTVQFILNEPSDLAETVSCQYAAYIYSPKAGNDPQTSSKWFYEGNIDGTGPYMLQSYTKGSEIVLTKFEDYWGGWEGNHFDKVVIKVVSEPATRRQMIEGGEADIALAITSADAEAMAGKDGINVGIYAASKNNLCFFNMLKAPLDNKLVRQAIANTFPYEDVIQYVKLNKYGSLPTDVAVPAGDRGATSSVPYAYDLEKAKALLDQAGFKPGDLTLEVTYSANDEECKKMMEMWKSELDKIGVTLNITALTWDAAYSRAKSPNPQDRSDLFVVEQWTDTLTSYSVYSSLCLKDASWNFAGLDNPELEKALAEAYAMTPFDREKSTAMLEKVGQMAAEECFVISLADMKDIVATRSDFLGFESNPAYAGTVFFYDCHR